MGKIADILVSILIAMTVVFLFSLSLSPTWNIQRRLFINAGAETIMPYVNTPGKWEKWNVWLETRKAPSVVLVSKTKNVVVYRINANHDRENDVCLVMLSQADYGTYVFVKVTGTLNANPMMRYLLLANNDFFGSQLENGLRDLKKMVEGR